jgi:methylmalonyl-CoA mutase N-terminal domain/subunit
LIVCYGTPEETNDAFKEYIAAGQTGLRILTDTATLTGVDPDHPLARYTIKSNGCPTFALTEFETMLDGIPLESVDFEVANSTPSGSFLTYCSLLALAERRGADLKQLRGTNINDPIHAAIVYDTPEFPNDLAKRINLDQIEFSARATPLWHPCTPCGYDMRDYGLTSPQEVAFVLANAIQYYGDAIKERGVRLDDFRPMTFSMSAEADLFETVAKFRAVRRMWARLARERLGARNLETSKCRLGVRTAGSSLYPQKAVNNIARITLQTLSAVLGGVQSIDPCAMDEPVGEPSREARVLNLDIQHIITHEANVPLVADPLAGSYYVDWLTNRIEEEAGGLLGEIDARGGMWASLESGFLREQFNATILQVQREIETKQRVIVGVNDFVGSDGPVSETIIANAYKVPDRQDRLLAVQKVAALKQTRHPEAVRDALTELHRSGRRGGDLVRPTVEALKAQATWGEIVGTLRLAAGYGFDPYGIVAAPDFLRHLPGAA